MTKPFVLIRITRRSEGIVLATLRILIPLILFVLATPTLLAQGNLSELFSIIRKEDPATTDNGRKREFEILEQYTPDKKSLDGEWQAIDSALSDSSPFVRDQACAVLSTIALSQIRDGTLGITEHDESIRSSAEAAIRILSEPPPPNH